MTSGQDPHKYFRIEAREILEEVGKGILHLEGQHDPTLVARLLRLVHTLKGAARVVKQGSIAERAHAIEEALAPLRAPGGALEPQMVQTVLGLLDAIAADVAGLELPRAREAAAPAESGHALRADVREVDGLLDTLSEASVQLRSLRRVAETAARAGRLSDLLLEEISRGGAREAGRAARSRSLAQDVRSAVTAIGQELGGGLDLVERELVDARDAAEKLRLASASSAYSVLERVVHDAAQATGRRVTFVARGGEIRLDAQVLSQVQNALVQLARNAVAHGIESPADRMRLGKPAVGVVEISAQRRGGRIAFACADDGRGFDLQAVRRAVEHAGPGVAASATTSDAELLRLLFRGGLTTSRDVTQVAGRGIGLDVVRDAATAVGGEVHIESKPGRGARVEIVVPISLSSIDGLFVEIGAATAVIPLDAVRRTIRVGPADVVLRATGESIVSDGEVVPLMTLARRFGAAEHLSRQQQFSAVVVTGPTALAAVRVDRIIGTRSAVVRPLPPGARADAMVAGAALDAEGNPQPVLDPAGLVAAALAGETPDPVRDREKPRPILIIDDSLTTRRLEQSILESAGYEVELATSAEEGLAKARAGRYSLFLVDVEMPGMNGFSFVEETRKDPVLRDVPAILVTSRSSPEDRQRGQQAGARAFIAKGEFDQSELLDAIRRLRS